MAVARSVIALVACMFLIAVQPCMAQDGSSTAKPQGSDETHAPARFDIDAQPLAKALRAFSEATGIAVLFDDALVASLSTHGVHGNVDPRDALRILLVDTGLEAQFASMNAFTVTAAHVSQPADGEPPSARGASDVAPDIDGTRAQAIQRAIEHALCAHKKTMPGAWRQAMQLWVDDGGAIVEVAALAPSGNDDRDAMVVQALMGVHLPSVTRRFNPVTVLVAPSPDGARRCTGGG